MFLTSFSLFIMKIYMVNRQTRSVLTGFYHFLTQIHLISLFRQKAVNQAIPILSDH